MNNKITLSSNEINELSVLFINGFKKQITEYYNESLLLENYSPDEMFLLSLKNYLEEVYDVTDDYKLFNIKKLIIILLEIINNIINNKIFSNVFVKDLFLEIFNEINNLNKSDKEITSLTLKNFISRKDEILRKNQIISNEHLNFDILKNRFDYNTYESIRNEYKNILILLNRLTTLSDDIKKIKSKTKNKFLKSEIESNIMTLSNVAVSFQEILNKVYYQPIGILFQKIETELSKLEFNVEIKEYVDDIIIIPEIFLFLYNDFSDSLTQIKKITKDVKIKIFVSELNDVVKITFIFKDAKKYYLKFKSIFELLFLNNKYEYLTYDLFQNLNDLILKIKFQNIIFYL